MKTTKIVAIMTFLILMLNILIPSVTLAVDEVQQKVENNTSNEVVKEELVEDKSESEEDNESLGENVNSENETNNSVNNETENTVNNVESNEIIKDEGTNEENVNKKEEVNDSEETENTIEQPENIESISLDKSASVLYKSHVQDEGWQEYVKDGELSGTTGKERRVEAIQIELGNSSEISGASIKYQVHAQDYGWMDWKKDGEIAGTVGEAKRIEAIKIELESLDGYSVVYRTHVQDIGWTDWVNNGEISGTVGKEKRVEAIEIKIIKNPKIELNCTYNEDKNIVTAVITSNKALSNINDSSWSLSNDKLSFTKEYKENGYYKVIVNDIDGVKTEVDINVTQIQEPISMVKYSSHIETNGWEKNFSKVDGETSGTTGENKRLEAIQIALGNSEEISEGASIKYQVHVQDYGWMNWVQNGEVAGTIGEEKRIEAIKIKLEGMDGYSVIYRTHVQDIGWTDWVNNEEISGTVGEQKKIEAIEIKVVKNPKVEVSYTYNESSNTVTAKITSDKELSSISDSSWNLSGDKLSYSKEYDVNDIYNVTVKDIDGIEVALQVNITQVVEPISIVKYSSHIETNGWEKKFSKIDGETSGTTGESKRLEAIQISLGNSEEVPEGASIKYQLHVQDYGWMDWKQDGEIAGTIGEGKRIEAIKIEIEGMKGYCVEYRTHIGGIGWQKWKSDGAISGTIGEEKRIEAIQIRVVKEENRIVEPSVEYQSYIQNTGWQDEVLENTISGTTGQSKRIEALKIDLTGVNIESFVKYRVYTKNAWQSWENNGEQVGIAGQTGINAIQIELENLEGYSIEYRTYMSDYGWQKWKKDGEIAGIIGNNNVEAIQIRIVYNNSVTLEPEVSYEVYVEGVGWKGETPEGFLSGTTGESKRLEALKINLSDVDASQKIKYRVHVQDIGWQPWVKNGTMAGTTGQSKRIEAIQIELEQMDSYTVEYQVYIQDYGWSDWMIDGETAGTTGEGKRIEAIKIRIVPKYYREYKGIDVSEHNGLIDWQSVKNSGVQFAMIRCAYRGYRNPIIVEDKYFDYNVRNASAVGIKVGIYFFSQATSIGEAVEEANYAISLAKRYNCITYPIVIDTESSGAENNDGRADGLSVAVRTNVVAAFCNQVQNSGYTPMVYASRNWLYNNLEVTRLLTYETWLAHYTESPSIKSDYKYDYKMWQYTSSGSVPGVGGRVDLNIGYKKY